MKINCWIIFSLLFQCVLIQSAHIYSTTGTKLYYNSCGCGEIFNRKRRSVERKKRSLQRNRNSEENLNKFEETATGGSIHSNDDNNNEERLFEQPTRRRNRKKRELNYLKVDDVDINVTNGNIPTFKFKIEVNLSGLANFEPGFESVEIPGKYILGKVVSL